jgi:hypothetical protein
MTVRRRVLVLALAAVAVLASTASASGTPKACQAPQLKGKEYNSNGAAGTILVAITFTNTGASCSIKGYARLQLMAGARRALPTHVTHGGVPLITGKPKLVVLKHGGLATIVIAFSDVTVGNETKCETATEVLVKTPGENTWIGVLAPISACGHGSLRESPVLAGRRKAV